MPFEGEPATGVEAPPPPLADWRARARAIEVRFRWPLRLIVAPTLVVAFYYLLIAHNQYVSEASFLVRNPQTWIIQAPSLAGLVGGGGMPPSSETSGVADFLGSHDAAAQLQARVNIAAMYRRTGIDLLSRLWGRPTDEDLTRYYRKHVKVTLDPLTGITKLQVRAFRPEDLKRIADTLLTLSEELVNRFSDKEQADALKTSSAEVARAQQHLIDVGGQLTQFRQSRQSLDPNGASLMVMQVMGGLEGQLAKAKADFAAASGYLKPGSPRLEELRARVGALEGQVASQRARLTNGGAGGLAPTVAGYDRLLVERDFAARDYEAAMTAHEAARTNALKQHLFLVRVVEPNLAQKSLYPQRGLTILTFFAGLLVAYGLGWLILTGTREHAM